MTHKLTITIRIIFIIILALFIFAAIWWTQIQLYAVRESVGELDKGIDEVILEWSADYAKDKELLDKIDKDLIEAQARLEKLGVEFD